MKSPLAPPRRADRTRLPAALAALLALAAPLQFALPDMTELPPPGPISRFRLPPPEVTNAIVEPVILGRPLFSARRRVGGGPVAPGLAAAPVGPLGGAIAVGATRVGSRVRAFVQAPDGTVIELPPGGRYRGFRLIGVSASELVFGRGRERVRLPLGASRPPIAGVPTGDEAEQEEPTE